MDAPEGVQPYANESAAKNSELVYGKIVTLVKDVSETDQYNRLLRYVLVENIFVNHELVLVGLASAIRYPPDTACQSIIDSAEAIARNQKIGIWAPTPTRWPTATTVPGGTGPCSCSGNLYNCPDFNTQAEAQACYNHCMNLGYGDVHRLDADNDGRACESLP
jgi:micrococcal nuclease